GLIADPQSLNSYTYCRDNPLGYVDVGGEEATIIIREAREGESRDWGHVVIEVNGNVYEFYSKNPMKSIISSQEGIVQSYDGVDDFVDTYNTNTHDEQFIAIELDTTADQDAAIETYFAELSENTPDYSLFTSNCTTVVEGALEYAGIINSKDWNTTNNMISYSKRPVTPKGLQSRLIEISRYGSITIRGVETFKESDFDK
ncbi:TPA: hypothetical protein DCW56_01075, partial [Candidatus Peregrinibacteria bacterium]|nr:hypothetical protein [Candidatus Peregrinibacteria bacterium]